MADERDEVMRADDVADLDPYGVRKPPVQQQAAELLEEDEQAPASRPVQVGDVGHMPEEDFPPRVRFPILADITAGFFENKQEEESKENKSIILRNSFDSDKILNSNIKNIKEFKNYSKENKINNEDW